jgi:hypothetical protein
MGHVPNLISPELLTCHSVHSHERSVPESFTRKSEHDDDSTDLTVPAYLENPFCPSTS